MNIEKTTNKKSIVRGFLFLILAFFVLALIWAVIGNLTFTKKNISEEKGVPMYKKITANLMVKSVNETADFYEKYFGFKTTVTVPDSGEFDFAIIIGDEVELMIQKIESLGDDVPYLSNTPIGGSFTLFIEVENVEEIYNKIKGNVEILVDLKTTFYGMKEVTIKDLNGYVLTFAEKI
ncbi:MAG: bleomycin resistance family protein [Bacteroidetes bacterium]|nr:bleomycin resistance family protein [Bacteroidota bacterium]